VARAVVRRCACLAALGADLEQGADTGVWLQIRVSG